MKKVRIITITSWAMAVSSIIITEIIIPNLIDKIHKPDIITNIIISNLIDQIHKPDTLGMVCIMIPILIILVTYGLVHTYSFKYLYNLMKPFIFCNKDIKKLLNSHQLSDFLKPFGDNKFVYLNNFNTKLLFELLNKSITNKNIIPYFTEDCINENDYERKLKSQKIIYGILFIVIKDYYAEIEKKQQIKSYDEYKKIVLN